MGRLEIELELLSCDICGSNRYHTLLQTQDFIYKVPGTFNIVKCDFCGLLYLNPRPNQQSIVKLYEQYYDSGVSEKEKPSLMKTLIRKNLIMRRFWHYITGEYISEMLIKAKGKVLDIGCGCGDLLEDLHRCGCEVYGIEINPNAVAVCQQKGFNVFSGNLEEARFQEDFFDTIIMWHVIEHLPSPKKTLLEIRRILKPYGKVFIYCPNVESYLFNLFSKHWSGLQIPFHFYHFTGMTIRKLVETTGFQIGRIQTITPEHFFPYSLRSYLSNRNKFLLHFQNTRIFQSLFFRILTSIMFRILDSILKGRGECLRAELVKK